MPIGKLPPANTPQTRVDNSHRTSAPKLPVAADGSFKGPSRVSGVKALDAHQPSAHPIVQSHLASAEEFHEEIRDFDDLLQAGASHPDRLRDAGERVKVQGSPYETPVSGSRPADHDQAASPYEVPSPSKARIDHDYEDIDHLRPREIFDHLAPKLPQPNVSRNRQPSAYETPVQTQRPAEYEAPVKAPQMGSGLPIPQDYEDAASWPQNYETPLATGTTEPIYAEIGPGKNSGIYDQLDPQLPAKRPTQSPLTGSEGIRGQETPV